MDNFPANYGVLANFPCGVMAKLQTDMTLLGLVL